MTTQQIIEKLQFQYGQDFSVYATSFLRNALGIRVKETGLPGLNSYLDFIAQDNDELKKLTNSLHINYSLFFRNLLDTSLFECCILPELIQSKEKYNSRSFRMWSVGCAEGPEPYSFAMLADKVISDRQCEIPVMVFGTDISSAALDKAREGTYGEQAMQNVKLSFLDRFFVLNQTQYSVKNHIKNQVYFSQGDIIDPCYNSPPAAIFADFDLVSCCNLMIYYQQEIQQKILEKLHRSLAQNGYLLVGESERLIVEKFGKFRKLYPLGNVFIRK